MANNISVPVEDRETMLSGIVSMVTGPLDASTVTGKVPAAAALVVVSAGAVVVTAAVVLVVPESAAVVAVPLSPPQAAARSRVRIRAILLI
jgi:hypothetical protein